jgi:hypothetical protein
MHTVSHTQNVSTKVYVHSNITAQRHTMLALTALPGLLFRQHPFLFTSQVVGPGDEVQQLPESGSIRIGAGLRTQDGHVLSQKCGVVRQTRNGKIWLEGRQKRCVCLSTESTCVHMHANQSLLQQQKPQQDSCCVLLCMRFCCQPAISHNKAGGRRAAWPFLLACVLGPCGIRLSPHAWPCTVQSSKRVAQYVEAFKKTLILPFSTCVCTAIQH